MYQHFVQNASLVPYSTYHLGGKAKYLAFVYDTDGLVRALSLCERFVILGRGSKVLVSDDGFDGTVIIMRNCQIKEDGLGEFGGGGGINRISGAEWDGGAGGEGSVYVEAGVALPHLSRWFASRALAGLEWACAIPGSVGGALRLNAGAFGGDMSQLVVFADVLRGGRVVRLSAAECGFGYRHSAFFPSDIILGARLLAVRGTGKEIAERRLDFAVRREQAQPKGFSCGSVFKTGERPAYQYIEECGLKGLSLGGAHISDKHGNFILSSVGGRARDVFNLIRTAKAEVFAKFGVRLAEEVVFVGEF